MHRLRTLAARFDPRRAATATGFALLSLAFLTHVLRLWGW